MTLAAFDGDSLYQLVILALLGGGSLVKKFFEAKQGGAGAPGKGESVSQRRREETLSRLRALEQSPEEPGVDPWSASVEAEEAATQQMREPVLEAASVEEPFDLALATREESIEGGAIEEFSLEGGSFDQGTASQEPFQPGNRIRRSVFEDIEQSVAHDITEHVAADMAGGVRGEARKSEVRVQKVLHAKSGWRDAVIAAEILGSPVSLRDPASQPAGLRSE
jgi:hypothetical protein